MSKMKRSTKGWLVMLAIIGITMVVAAWNATGITSFINEKLPWLNKVKSKISK